MDAPLQARVRGGAHVGIRPVARTPSGSSVLERRLRCRGRAVCPSSTASRCSRRPRSSTRSPAASSDSEPCGSPALDRSQEIRGLGPDRYTGLYREPDRRPRTSRHARARSTCFRAERGDASTRRSRLAAAHALTLRRARAADRGRGPVRRRGAPPHVRPTAPTDRRDDREGIEGSPLREDLAARMCWTSTSATSETVRSGIAVSFSVTRRSRRGAEGPLHRRVGRSRPFSPPASERTGAVAEDARAPITQSRGWNTADATARRRRWRVCRRRSRAPAVPARPATAVRAA